VSYGYFEHDADIGIIGRGASPEEAFEGAAEAMFAIMADAGQIAQVAWIEFVFTEEDLELALVTWLNRLLAEARQRGLALGRFSLARADGQWHGEAWGAPWDSSMVRGTEVKGATLTMLHVGQTDGAWEARCVVDV
jgi:SHS2 domain-containing protein